MGVLPNIGLLHPRHAQDGPAGLRWLPLPFVLLSFPGLALEDHRILCGLVHWLPYLDVDQSEVPQALGRQAVSRTVKALAPFLNLCPFPWR